jgi:hypothetical protein
MQYIVFILFTVITNAAAQLMLKYGMVQLGPISFAGVNPGDQDPADRVQPMGVPRPVDLCHFDGLAIFTCCRRSSCPSPIRFLSLAYVLVAVFAYFVFREDLNALRIAGIGLICVGTVLIAQSGSKHTDEVAQISPETIKSSEIVR